MDRSENAVKVVVTGAHEEWLAEAPTHTSSGRPIQWSSAEVLEYERLPIDAELLRRVAETPFEWVLFTSRRAVTFFAEALRNADRVLPIESQVACIGERTAEEASAVGFTPDFYPTTPGSEAFLEEFWDLLVNRQARPTVLIPAAEGARTLIPQRLREWGCTVTMAPLYRTRPRSDASRTLAAAGLDGAAAVLFTSPSSVTAVLDATTLPNGIACFAIGTFTQSALENCGLRVDATVEAGDLASLLPALEKSLAGGIA
jgi:uroporphyrinogen-III synthase